MQPICIIQTPPEVIQTPKFPQILLTSAFRPIQIANPNYYPVFFIFIFLLCWFSPASVSCFLMLYKKMNRPTPLQVQNYCQQNVPEESKEGCQAANAAALVCGIVWLHFGGSGDALTLFCQNHPLISNKICHRRQTDIHLVVRNLNQNKC